MSKPSKHKRSAPEPRHAAFALSDTEFERYNALHIKLTLPEVSKSKAEQGIGRKSETLLALLMEQIGDK